MMNEKEMDRVREEIYQTVRFLAPVDAKRLFEELAKDMKRVADEYDKMLQNIL